MNFEKDNKFEEGYGKIQLIDGYTYEGKFKDGRFDGVGELRIIIVGVSNRHMLRVVADWSKGKITRAHLNDITSSFDDYYTRFNKCIMSIPYVEEDLNVQRTHYRAMIDLLEKSLASKNLLLEMSKQTARLPKELCTCADLLAKLYSAYESLTNNYIQPSANDNQAKKTIRECLNEACVHGIGIYARKLQWFDGDIYRNWFIKIADILGDSLREHMNSASGKSTTNQANWKRILLLDPNMVDMFKKMIRIVNDRINELPSNYREIMIGEQSRKLKSMWADYMQSLDPNDDTTCGSSRVLLAERQFFASAYHSLVSHSRLIETHVGVLLQDTSLSVRVNANNVVREDLLDNGKMKAIILDQNMLCCNNQNNFKMEELNISDTKETSVSETNLYMRFFDSQDSTHLILASTNTSTEFLDHIRGLHHILSEQRARFVLGVLESKMCAVLIEKLTDSTTSTRNMSTPLVEKRSIGDKLELSGHLKIKLVTDKSDEKTARRDKKISRLSDILDELKYDAMSFVVGNLTPWRDVNEMTRVREFLSQDDVSSSATTKEIGDLVLVKILKDAREHMMEFRGTMGKTPLVENFADEFAVLIDSYEANLRGDGGAASGDQEFRLKQINEILSYFLSVIEMENDGTSSGFMVELVKTQFANIQSFTRSKENITKLIECYVDFNVEIRKLDKKLDEKFHKTVFASQHEQILQSLKNIFISILSDKLDKRDPFHDQFVDDNDAHSESDASNTLKYFAIFNLCNLMSNLNALDINFYVEKSKLKNEQHTLLNHATVFALCGGGNNDDKVNVLDIKKSGDFLTDQQPKHAVLTALVSVLQLVEKAQLLDADSTRSDNLRARTQFIESVNKSLKYFKDQLKYASLEAFIKDCVDPFEYATTRGSSDSNKCTLDQFKSRLQTLELYFLYNRKLREITSEQAIDMFKQKNLTSSGNEAIKTLKKALKDYETTFEKSLNDMLNNPADSSTTIEKLIQKIKEKASKWTDKSLWQTLSSGETPSVSKCKHQLRLETIPKMIAEIAVIFSLQVN